MDGVAEAKSNSVSLDVYSIKFSVCRDIYPVKIIRPLVKGHVDHLAEFASVIDSIIDKGLKIKTVVADNPKRAFVRNSMQHSAKYACEYCFQSGVSCSTAAPDDASSIAQKIKDQRTDIARTLDNLSDPVQIQCLQELLNKLEETEKLVHKKKRGHIVWPASTMNGTMRTKAEIVEIVRQLEAGNEMTSSEMKGIKGNSRLLQIDDFDFVFSIPTEYMHSVPLGVVKRLLEVCFSVGESRPRITKRPLSSPLMFNELMKDIKFFKESSRRARKLDLAVLKAQELRNILLFFFPIVTTCLNGNEKESKLWEMLAFMIRACILPNAEYDNVNKNQIKYCQKNFYLIYEQLFGDKNCSYSIHVVISHLLDMRKYGPLTETSAFRFEAFYAELRKAFQPGTTSVVKQMMQTVLLKRKLTKHICEEKIYLNAKDTALECNSMIYVFDNNVHSIYKIKSIENDETLVCNQLGNHSVSLPCTTMLNWSAVGVYRKGGLSSEDVIIMREQVAGKVIRVLNYLITCPANILREK